MNMKKLAEILGRHVRGHVAGKVDPLQEAVRLLEKRVSDLESRPEMKYCGVFDTNKSYRAGDFVTHAGSLWCCKQSNIGYRPGEGDHWQLAVKRGADGKDAR